MFQNKQQNNIILHTFTLLISCIIAIPFTIAQDVQFSQYQNTMQYINPASGAVSPYTTFHANHRTQFTGLGDPFSSYYFAANMPVTIKGIRDSHLGGIGFNALQDDAGSVGFSTTIANLNLSYRVPLSGDQLHNLYFGLSGGVWQQRINQRNMITGSQYQGTNEAGGTYQLPDTYQNQYLSPEINGGLSYTFNPTKDDEKSDFSLEGGFSFRQINRVSQSFGDVSSMSRMYNAHAGVTFHLSSRIHLSSQTISTSIQGKHHIMTGLEVHTFILNRHTKVVPNFITIGSYYRFEDAFVPMLAMGSDYYRIGFSYDAFRDYQRLAGIPNHTYEIALSLTLYKSEGEKEVIKQPRYIRDVL